MYWIRTDNYLPEHDGWYLCWMYYGGWDKLYFWSDYGVFTEDAGRYMKEDEHRAFEEGEVLYWAEVEEPEEETEKDGGLLGWTRITDKKPPEGEYVLVYDGNYYIMRYKQWKEKAGPEVRAVQMEKWESKTGVTYCLSDGDLWKPLPEAPDVEV